MPRMRVTLDSVTCRDTEDVTGADELYLVGAVTAGDEASTRAILTRPLSIDNGQTSKFGEGGGTVFDAHVEDGRLLKIAFAAMDEDAGKDWARREELITKVTKNVSDGLRASGDPQAVAAAQVLPLAVQGLGLAVQLDADDELGQHLCEYPVGVRATVVSTQSVPFQKTTGRWGWSTWQYTVTYHIVTGDVDLEWWLAERARRRREAGF